MKKLSEIVNEKDFNVKPAGYDAREVDNFLDEISEKIVALENEIVRLNETISIKESELQGKKFENLNLKQELVSTKGKTTANDRTFNGEQNLETIKRLSRLEDKVERIIRLLDENNKS